jgi:hypothetical protein
VNDPNIVGSAGPLDARPDRHLDVPPQEKGPAGLPLVPPGEEDTTEI